MAAPKKKRVTANDIKNVEELEPVGPEDAESMEEGESDCDEDSEMVNEEVQVEFEARNPEDSDFSGIRKLLSQLFLKSNVNISELADTVISQNYVGSVIKQVDMPEDDDSDDDMDVFGVISVLNMTEKKDLDSISQVRSLVLEKCQQCSQKHKAQLQTILDNTDNHLGLVLNERFINLPPQISLPSFESLWKEIEKAKKKNMKYSFSKFMLIGKTYKMPSGAGIGKNQPHQQSNLTFVNAEEEFFHKEAVLTFDFSVASERDMVCGGGWDDDDDELEPFRTVMIVPADRIPVIMQKMKETFSLPPPEI